MRCGLPFGLTRLKAVTLLWLAQWPQPLPRPARLPSRKALPIPRLSLITDQPELQAALAEFETETDEGRQRAKAKGIKFGRKPKLTKHQREEALARKRNGETLTAIAKSYNVSHMTICRLQT